MVVAHSNDINPINYEFTCHFVNFSCEYDLLEFKNIFRLNNYLFKTYFEYKYKYKNSVMGKLMFKI